MTRELTETEIEEITNRRFDPDSPNIEVLQTTADGRTPPKVPTSSRISADSITWIGRTAAKQNITTSALIDELISEAIAARTRPGKQVDVAALHRLVDQLADERDHAQEQQHRDAA